jgi:hypothetical protein
MENPLEGCAAILGVRFAETGTLSVVALPRTVRRRDPMDMPESLAYA